QILDEQADRADMRQRLPYVRAHSVLLSGWVLFRPPPGGEIIGLQKQRGPAGAGHRQTRIVLELERLALVLAAAVVAAELVAVVLVVVPLLVELRRVLDLILRALDEDRL